MRHASAGLAAIAAIVLSSACGPGPDPAAAGAQVTIRIGHFPNVTHAHGLVAHAMSRSGHGWFEERCGPGTRIEWFTYNAGPSAMEALLAGSIDATYVGPNPAINAHLKSKGDDVRVIAGATRGGAALVVRGDGSISSAADFRGRRLATPQLGNTQDVSARAWLAAAGLRVTMGGGDVSVLPTQNPDQLALFRKGELDGVWTVEPWVSRLEREAGGRILVEETDSLTTVLAASAEFLRSRPAAARALAVAHAELDAWIASRPDEAKSHVIAELKDLTRAEMPRDLLDHCWPRLRFTPRIATDDFVASLVAAQSAGFLTDAGEPHAALARLVEVPR